MPYTAVTHLYTDQRSAYRGSGRSIQPACTCHQDYGGTWDSQGWSVPNELSIVNVWDWPHAPVIHALSRADSQAAGVLPTVFVRRFRKEVFAPFGRPPGRTTRNSRLYQLVSDHVSLCVRYSTSEDMKLLSRRQASVRVCGRKTNVKENPEHLSTLLTYWDSLRPCGPILLQLATNKGEATLARTAFGRGLTRKTVQVASSTYFVSSTKSRTHW